LIERITDGRDLDHDVDHRSARAYARDARLARGSHLISRGSRPGDADLGGLAPSPVR
jgi:hypothetical protein